MRISDWSSDVCSSDLWRFATTPKWIVRHVLVVAVVGATLWAGFWQLRRLDEKRDQRDQVEAQQHQPVIDIASVIPADVEVGDAAVEAVVYRPVTATGTYADDEPAGVEHRSYNGTPGEIGRAYGREKVSH